MDVHVPRPVTRSLRRREVDVLTAQEDGTAQWEDPDLLDRAGALARVLFSQDADLLAEAAKATDGRRIVQRRDLRSPIGTLDWPAC
jgi:hypothetical protein